MSEPYRPIDMDALLRCERCGDHPNDTGAEIRYQDMRAVWQCTRCDRLVVADIPRHRFHTYATPAALEELRAILSDDDRLAEELAAILRGDAPGAAPADLNADRLPVIDLRDGR